MKAQINIPGAPGSCGEDDSGHMDRWEYVGPSPPSVLGDVCAGLEGAENWAGCPKNSKCGCVFEVTLGPFSL